MNIIGLTLESIEGSVEKLRTQNFAEPVPNFYQCNLLKLSASLKSPFQRPEKKSQIENFCQKGALIFCFLIENHPFPNANKRIAVVSLITMADINGYKIIVSNIRLYAMAMGVTLLSKYNLFNQAINEVETMIKDTITRKPGKPISKKRRKRLKSEFENFLEN